MLQGAVVPFTTTMNERDSPSPRGLGFGPISLKHSIVFRPRPGDRIVMLTLMVTLPFRFTIALGSPAGADRTGLNSPVARSRCPRIQARFASKPEFPVTLTSPANDGSVRTSASAAAMIDFLIIGFPPPRRARRTPTG